ncbi:MAG: FAD-dependent monooxygenase [Candidatus Pelagibacter sp.]
MKKIAIIGGGISGLYIANLLEKEKDYKYKIFEKRSKLNVEEGYGIQLSVNSIKLLNKINFRNISAADICFPSKVNFFKSNNPNKICDIDLTQFNDDLNRYTTIKRSTLLKFLLESIPKDKIKFNTTLSHLDYSNNIKAYFSDASEENFDFLIIADGVFSQSKLIITKESSKPKYNNSIALRGKLNKHNDNNISIFMGSNFHYVIYPVNQSSEYNFVAILHKKLTETQLENQKILQSEEFINSLKEILIKNSSTNLENLSNIQVFPVFVSKVLPTTNQKNVFFSGDALFAFPPSFAQGASQSIETAHDIFESIISGSDNLYKKRISRIHSINWRSKLNHFAFHLSNPINIFIRNLILKYISKNKKFLNSYLGKIYRN